MSGQLGYDENGQVATQQTADGKLWSLILGASQRPNAIGKLGVDENGQVVTQDTATGKTLSLILGAIQNL